LLSPDQNSLKIIIEAFPKKIPSNCSLKGSFQPIFHIEAKIPAFWHCHGWLACLSSNAACKI